MQTNSTLQIEEELIQQAEIHTKSQNKLVSDYFQQLIKQAIIIKTPLNVVEQKSKFENMPAFNLWQDRNEIADIENHVEQLRKL